MNRLIGRAAETEILTDLLTTHGQRLLTVTGVSGVGKSRLLLDVATVLHADQDWSVIWTSRRSMGEPVPKSPLGDLVNRALSGCSDAVDELVDAVLDRQVLMVVDGHDGVQRLDLTVFGELLRRCPCLSVAITSLAPVRAPGEQVLPLAPLQVSGDPSTPGAAVDGPALQLLSAHLQRTRPGRVPSAELSTTLTSICRLLDGVPRALEYAAEWCLLHSPETLLMRLRSGTLVLGPPPTGAGGLTVPDAMARSLAVLTAQERAVLSDLAGLDGGWSAEEAARHTRRSHLALASAVPLLVACGLVRPCADHEDRFEVLNLVRANRHYLPGTTSVMGRQARPGWTA